MANPKSMREIVQDLTPAEVAGLQGENPPIRIMPERVENRSYVLGVDVQRAREVLQEPVIAEAVKLGAVITKIG